MGETESAALASAAEEKDGAKKVETAELPVGGFEDLQPTGTLETKWIEYRGKRFLVEFREIGGLEATQMLGECQDEDGRTNQAAFALQCLTKSIVRIGGAAPKPEFYAGASLELFGALVSAVVPDVEKAPSKNSQGR